MLSIRQRRPGTPYHCYGTVRWGRLKEDVPEHSTGRRCPQEAREYADRLEIEVRHRIMGRNGFSGVVTKPKARPERCPARWYVYLVQAGESAVKIGLSTDLGMVNRLEAIQTSNHEELRLLALIPGGPALERELHQRFAEDRIRGEWFRASDQLLAFAKEHA